MTYFLLGIVIGFGLGFCVAAEDSPMEIINDVRQELISILKRIGGN